MNNCTPKRLVRRAAVRAKLGGCSAMTLWRYQQHDFPEPIHLVPGGPPLWDEDAVDRWIEQRAAMRLQGPPRRVNRKRHETTEAEPADAA